MTLRIGRTIFAVLIGLSVATLPAATGFAANAATATDMSASKAMPDCDHHHNAPSDKTQKTAGDCACMAACALTCFSFTAPGFSGITFSPAGQCRAQACSHGHQCLLANGQSALPASSLLTTLKLHSNAWAASSRGYSAVTR